MGTVDASWIEPVLALALRAPSAGNAQPWQLAWDGERLEVRVDPERVPMGDARLSHLQLGCLVESIDLAARRAGRSFALEAPREASAFGPEVVLRLSDERAPPSPLASALALRVTDRRLFLGGRVDARLRDELARDADALGAGLHLLDGCPEDLLQHLARWEALWIEWERLAVVAMLRWARWSEAEALATQDGAHWANLGMPYPVSRAFALAQRRPEVLGWLREAGLAHGVMRTATRRLRSSAGVALVTTRAETPLGGLPAGQLFLRAWLALQQEGFGVHPMSLAASTLAQHQLGHAVPDDAPASLRALLAEGGALFARAFGLLPGEVPAFFFRFGVSPGPFPLRRRTLRRPLAEVLTP